MDIPGRFWAQVTATVPDLDTTVLLGTAAASSAPTSTTADSWGRGVVTRAQSPSTTSTRGSQPHAAVNPARPTRSRRAEWSPMWTRWQRRRPGAVRLQWYLRYPQQFPNN